MKIQVLLLFCIGMLLFSCNQEKLSRQSERIDSLEWALEASKDNELKAKKVSLDYQDYLLGKVSVLRDSLKRFGNSAKKAAELPVEVVTMNMVHGDEFEEEYNNMKWTGLFRSGENFYIAPADVKFNKVHDGLLDEPGEATGVEPAIEGNTDECIYLFSPLSTPDKERVDQINFENIIMPGDTVNFDFLKKKYTLYATGTIAAPDNLKVSDYKLYFRNNKNSQLLVDIAEFDDAMTEIRWAGDLDRDGKPDFIIDTSDHYNVREITLFLSSYALKGEIVRIAGIKRMVGC